MFTACIDLDGVLAYYDGWKGDEHIGHSLLAGILMTKLLKEEGFDIIIYTCRLNGCWGSTDYGRSYSRIEKWLKDNNVVYDKIATQKDGKPYADVYIDDRSLWFPTNNASEEVTRKICKVAMEMVSEHNSDHR